MILRAQACRVPREVWALGFVSLLMDFSSETIHALLPVFMTTALGTGMVAIGVIEGVAEATAAITKVFSGVLSDSLGRRKSLAVIGYGIAAISKPLFPLATSAGWVLSARVADRIGKGIRGAPRDALVADLSPPEIRGAAYGLRQSLDTVGAFLGPLAAIGLMRALAGDVRQVFWWAAAPAWAAVILLVFAVHEPAHHVVANMPRGVPGFRELGLLGSPFWSVTGVGTVFTLARFSEAFVVLRCYDAGLTMAWTPLALVVMNLAYLASAYPAGRMSDGMDRFWLLAAGLVVLIAADVVLAVGQGLSLALLGVALWGLHMGLTQGLLAAMVADAGPATLRGSAFGVFNLAGGLATLLASVIAGILWTWGGSSLTFAAGASFSTLALAGLIWRRTFGARRS